MFSRRIPTNRLVCRLILAMVFGGFAAIGFVGAWAQEQAEADTNKGDTKQSVITVSEETTFFTEPLDDEGYVDYILALDHWWRERLGDRENGARLFLQAIGGRAEGNVMTFACERLGVEIPEAEERFFKAFNVYGQQQGWDAEKISEVASEIANMQQPAKAEAHPEAAEWLEYVEPGLALVSQAVESPGWYIPRTSAGEVVAILLPEIQISREVSRALKARAMFRLAAGDREGAWRDILTIKRLGRKIATGPTFVEKLVGYAIDSIGGETANAYLTNIDEMNADFISIREDLAQLSEFEPLSKSLVMERVMMLDLIQTLARGMNSEDGRSMAEYFGMLGVGGEADPVLLGMLSSQKLDFDFILREANGVYDKISDGMNQADLGERQKQLGELEADIKQREKSLQQLRANPLPLAQGLVFPKRAGRIASQAVADTMVACMVPAIGMVGHAETLTRNQDRMLLLVTYLQEYRHEVGSFPATLAEAVSESDHDLTLDMRTGEPFSYKVIDRTTAWVYQSGNNQVDDGGTSEMLGEGNFSDDRGFIVKFAH